MNYVAANARACELSLANPGCVYHVCVTLRTASQSATGVPEVDQNAYRIDCFYDGTAVASYVDGVCRED